jgi:putative MATE family efflux protein
VNLDLTQGSIKEHIKTLAIPSSIGYFFHTMFNVTDTYFAGNISTEAIASLSLSFSIFFSIIAISGGMSQGVTALVGNAMGAKDEKNTKQIILHAFAFALFLALFMTTLGIWSTPFLLRQLGANGSYFDTAYAYISLIIMGAGFFVGVMFSNALLNSIGNTRAFRNFLIAGFFFNIILDFWFVKGGLGVPPMGVKGIALATIIIEFCGMCYLLFELKKTHLLQDLPKFSFDIQIIADIFKQGFPATVNMVLMALGMFIITYYIAPFGQHVVAAYGVAIRIEQIVLLPSIGLNVAVLSIVSQNNGAKAYERVKECVKVAQSIGFKLWLIGMVFLFAFSSNLLAFFTDDVQVIEAGETYLYIAALAIYAYVLVFINISLLQGIKQPALLIYLSLFRQLIVPAVVFTIFTFLGLPLVYYWFGIACFIWLSAWFILWYAKKKMNALPEH